MKNNIIKESIKTYASNRYLLLLSVSLVLLAIGFLVYLGFNVRPSELQLVSHYSAFGTTHLYRDQWYYLLNFGVFAIFMAVMHIILTVKLYILKGSPLAIAFAWLGIVIMLLAWFATYAVINVWSPS
jgi:hypothetical protein